MRTSEMVVKVTFGSTVTIAEVEVKVAGMDWFFLGEAKMHPSDTYNREIGELYAISRAMRNAGELLDIVASGRVDQAWQARSSTS